MIIGDSTLLEAKILKPFGISDFLASAATRKSLKLGLNKNIFCFLDLSQGEGMK
ncbi:MAG: hypothetical protein KKF30_17210 [Proteobacteria bacterium]|nr:hypothetical protein [Pseudomonadota bacterium]MBU4469119.1 hypothetical protein [Pseudomonadota bacterium]MCG2752150.1 hypothetical protein [Desulfobacteraceae bacterium]